MGRVRSPKRRVRDDDFIFGLCSDHGRIVFKLAEAIQGFSADILNSEFRGRCSIWWCWTVTSVAPRIVNDVSYVTRINHEIHFSWQAQYLVKLECHFSWQAQHLVTFWEIAGTRNVVFFHTKCVSKMGRVRSPKRRVRDDDFMVGSCSDHGRIILGICSNRLSIGGSNSRSFRWNVELTDFVAGAVFGEVGGWLCLLRAL